MLKARTHFYSHKDTSLTLTFLNGFDGISNTYLIKLKQLITTISRRCIINGWEASKISFSSSAVLSAYNIILFDHNFSRGISVKLSTKLNQTLKPKKATRIKQKRERDRLIETEPMDKQREKSIKLCLNVIKKRVHELHSAPCRREHDNWNQYPF